MKTLLYLEIALVLLASGGIGYLAYRYARLAPVAIALAALAAGWLVLETALFRHTALFAMLIPWPDVVVLANGAPVAVAVLVAMLLRLRRGPLGYSVVVAIALAGMGTWQSYGWVFKDQPVLRERWSRGVCLQSSDASCSAAAAATLLTMHDIPATEAEMAGLCLTTTEGTSLLGLYRGLRLKTEGTPWRVEAFGGSVAGVYENGPSILSVGLGHFQEADPRYARWGWTPGLLHTVVFVRPLSEDRLLIADPSIGRERWFVRDMVELWNGQGFRLVRREQG